MLESALARPKNLWHHGEGSVFRLAAACAYGIAMNHPFIDGNMRAAFVVSLLFMELNGYSFMAGELECARGFLSLAAGDIDEAELAGWFERWSSPQASE
jgi:death-on-curing protein